MWYEGSGCVLCFVHFIWKSLRVSVKFWIFPYYKMPFGLVLETCPTLPVFLLSSLRAICPSLIFSSFIQAKQRAPTKENKVVEVTDYLS